MPINAILSLLRKNKLIIKLSLLSLSLISVMCTGAIAPALPKILNHYNYIPNAKFLVRLIVTVPHLVIGLTSAFLGHMLNSLNRKYTLMIAIIVYSIIGSLGYFIENIYVIIFTRALLGISIAIVLSLSSTLIADYFDGEERSQMIGLQTTTMSIGTITYGLLSGIIADIHWKYNFLLYLFPLFLSILIGLFITEPRDSKNKIKLSKPSFSNPSTNVTQNKFFSISLIYILGMFTMVLYYLIPLQLPFLLNHIKIESSKMISITLSIETLSAALTALLYSKLKQTKGFMIITRMGFLIMSLSYYIITNYLMYKNIILAMVLYGMGMGLIMPNLTLWIIHSAIPKNRGAIVGGLFSCLYFGKFICSYLLYKSSSIINLSTNPNLIYKFGYTVHFIIFIILAVIDTINYLKKVSNKKMVLNKKISNN